MSIVVVERSFAQPVEYTHVHAREHAIAACLERSQVRRRYSLLARDGRRMVCVYAAPDAEAVRAAQHEIELPYEHVWSAQQLSVPLSEPDPRYATVVVQRELPTAVTREQAEAGAADPNGCHRRNRSQLLASLLSFDGRRMICRFSAPDAEAVRNASIQGGVPFTRAWTASVYGEPG